MDLTDLRQAQVREIHQLRDFLGARRIAITPPSLSFSPSIEESSESIAMSVRTTTIFLLLFGNRAGMVSSLFNFSICVPYMVYPGVSESRSGW